MKSFRRFLAIMLKELRQLQRDRITIGMIVGVPLIQILLFGYAINNDIRNLHGAVADGSNSHLSRQYVQQLEQTQVVDLQRKVESVEKLKALLKSGDIAVGLYIPPDFERRTLSTERPAAQLLVDGADPTVAGVADKLAQFPIHFDSDPNAIPAKKANYRTLEIRTYYNPTHRTAVYIIPGLMGIILTLTMTLFTAVALVREKERGNMELLINTPVRTPELMIGKLVPYILIGLIQVALIAALGNILFNVPVRGSVIDLYLAASLFIAANLAMGLLLSTLAKTQFQAIQLTIMLLLPSILLSGFLFPFNGMPQAAQYLGEVLPITHFIRLTRGIMLRGADIASLYQELFALALFMVVVLLLSALRFSRKLD